jgi:hypothetical protein
LPAGGHELNDFARSPSACAGLGRCNGSRGIAISYISVAPHAHAAVYNDLMISPYGTGFQMAIEVIAVVGIGLVFFRNCLVIGARLIF